MENRILEFIKKFIADKGYSPTVREIGKAMGINSTSRVHLFLDKLKTKDVIQWERGLARTIKVKI